MLIVHITSTHLAGAPIRIVNAINNHSKYSARLIMLTKNNPTYIKRTYPTDLIYDENKAESLSLIKKADIIHFHHFFDIKRGDNPFNLDFYSYTKNSCKFVRHFHTNLDTILSWTPDNTNLREKIINDPLPKFVVPHCAQRYFLDAKVVPNIIPHDDELYLPYKPNNSAPIVFFSSTSSAPAWKERWETKGKNEVLKIIKKLEKKGLCKLRFVEQMPYEECLKLKQSSDIVVGDVITGSYHLTELEALSMGKPVVCYIDGNTQLTLTNLTGCKAIPFINTSIEYLEKVLIDLCNNKNLVEEIGSFSRNWVENYYHVKNMVQIYIKCYKNIVKNQWNIGKKNNAEDFLNRVVYDYQWQARKNYAKGKYFNFLKICTKHQW